jgi:hypothetical protein
LVNFPILFDSVFDSEPSHAFFRLIATCAGRPRHRRRRGWRGRFDHRSACDFDARQVSGLRDVERPGAKPIHSKIE